MDELVWRDRVHTDGRSFAAIISEWGQQSKYFRWLNEHDHRNRMRWICSVVTRRAVGVEWGSIHRIPPKQIAQFFKKIMLICREFNFFELLDFFFNYIKLLDDEHNFMYFPRNNHPKCINCLAWIFKNIHQLVSHPNLKVIGWIVMNIVTCRSTLIA